MGIMRYRNIIVAWIVFIISEVFAGLIIYCLMEVSYTPKNEKEKSAWSPHVVIMATSCIIVNGHGMVAFRLLPGYKTAHIKCLHAIIQTLTGGGAAYAYLEIDEFMDGSNEFSRLHLIFAGMTGFLYVMQWIWGMFIFINKHTTQRRRKVFSAWHNFTGICILQFSIATAVLMLQEVSFTSQSELANTGFAIISIVCYGVMINIIVLNPYLEWPLVGPL